MQNNNIIQKNTQKNLLSRKWRLSPRPSYWQYDALPTELFLHCTGRGTRTPTLTQQGLNLSWLPLHHPSIPVYPGRRRDSNPQKPPEWKSGYLPIDILLHKLKR